MYETPTNLANRLNALDNWTSVTKNVDVRLGCCSQTNVWPFRMDIRTGFEEHKSRRGNRFSESN